MKISCCRVCDSTHLVSAIDLGMQPRANHFLKKSEIGKEPYYPLHVVYCEDCHTAQLDYTITKEEVNSGHTYLSGVTKSLADHFYHVAKTVDDEFFKEQKMKSVLDIGSNDGTQLLQFQKLGYDVLGVEASEQVAEIANRNGVKTMHAFFNLDMAKSVPLRFDVINAAGVFFHLEELHSVCKAIKHLLKEDGVFVVQCMYARSIQDNGAFDQIYHEHLLYYTLETLNTLLKRHGLSLFDSWFSPIHGGSLMAYAGHEGTRAPTNRLKEMQEDEERSGCNSLDAYKALNQKIADAKEANLAYLKEKKAQGKKVIGMGAPVKGNTLLNTFEIGSDYLDCLVEKNTLRKETYSPGQHLPILMEDDLESPPDVYYVLAWNFREEILKRNQALIDQGVEFYFPIVPGNVPCVVS